MIISLRTKLEIGILLLFGISLFLGYTFYNKYKEEVSQKKGLEQLFAKNSESVKLYVNNHNQIVAQNKALTLENSTIKQLVKDGNLQYLKEFDNLKKNFKNLESTFQVQSNILDSMRIKIYDTTRTYIDSKGDTIKFQAHDWKYKDKWSSFKVKEVSPDSIDFQYSINVPLEGVTYWKRKWFLGKKTWYSEITSENPHVKITGLQNIRVGKK